MSATQQRRGRPCHRAALSKAIDLDADNSDRTRWCCQQAGPSSMGLTPDEVVAEAIRLLEHGWSIDEIVQVLQLPPEVIAR